MSSPPLPTANEIHLWTLPHGEGNPALLSPLEKARLKSYHHETDQRRYCFTQSAKRKILGRYLAQAPEELVFQENEHGKPSLTGLEFSISHTTGLSVLAVATDQPIGVDIEAITPQNDLPALARHIMSESEWAIYLQLSEAERLPHFYRLWTAKEAYLKSLGTGFTIEPSEVVVELSGSSIARAKGQPQKHLLERPLDDEVVVQLASGRPVDLELWQWGRQ